MTTLAWIVGLSLVLFVACKNGWDAEGLCAREPDVKELAAVFTKLEERGLTSKGTSRGLVPKCTVAIRVAVDACAEYPATSDRGLDCRDRRVAPAIRQLLAEEIAAHREEIFGASGMNPSALAGRADDATDREVAEALETLRRDDSKAKATAADKLSSITARHPASVEGHAALLTARSLQLDDVQQRVRRIEQLVERKNTLIARYSKEKSPANWEALAQALSVQVEELITEHKPLAEAGQQLDSQAREAYMGLESAVTRVGDPTKQARLAAVRAQALFHAISGTDQALVLAKRYETMAEGAAPDGWIDLAIPEFAANARVSEELMQQAQVRLEELHKRDSTFLRTFVLSARLRLIKKDIAGAGRELDQALVANEHHDLAAELRGWVGSRQ